MLGHLWPLLKMPQAPPPAPPTPTLTITDSGDGTGATATIAGSSAGSTNTVYTSPVPLSSGSLSWTASGSRTGDGTISLSLTPGPYLAYCESAMNGLNATPSNEVFFKTTGGATAYESPHAAVAHSVQQTIIGLIGTKITGVAADSVRVRKVPSAVDFSGDDPLPAGMHAYPGILIVYGDKERDLAGVNDRDDVGFPLAVVFAAKDVDSRGVSDLEDNDDEYLTWRKVISDTFRNQPYTITNYTVTNPLTFQTCQIEYGPIVDWSRWQRDQVFAGSFNLIFVLRKGRGLNPAN